MATTSENSNFADEVFGPYPLDSAIEWIQRNLNPDDVFSNNDLDDWAEANGYIKE